MKSNIRLPPDGILSPSPCSSHFQKRLQNLAYGSLPSADLSRWHLKPIPVSSPISNLKSSIRLIPQRSLQLLQMASISPFPHYQSNGECKLSGVLECSIIFYLQVTKGKACQSNPSSTRRLNRGTCHTPKFSLMFLKIFHTSMLKDSSRVDQTNSLLGNQPKLGFGIYQINMDF